jgi:outer membrane lipoprotein LolB
VIAFFRLLLMIRRLFAGAVCAAALSGCATNPVSLSHNTVGAYRESATLAGNLSVNYQKDGQPQQPIGVKFNWEQTPGHVHVSLASPLGQTLAVIDVTPDSATLTEANRAPRVAKDLETLTRDTLGWSLPVSGLRDWLQGYAVKADGQRFIASPADSNVVTQDGWHVHFVSWQDDQAAVPQVKRIDAERNANGNDLAIRINVYAAE